MAGVFVLSPQAAVGFVLSHSLIAVLGCSPDAGEIGLLQIFF